MRRARPAVAQSSTYGRDPTSCTLVGNRIADRLPPTLEIVALWLGRIARSAAPNQTAPRRWDLSEGLGPLSHGPVGKVLKSRLPKRERGPPQEGGLPRMHDDCPEERGDRLKRGRGLPEMHNDCTEVRGDRLKKGRGLPRMHNDCPDERGDRLKRGRGLPQMHNACLEERGARLKRGKGLPEMHDDCPEERGDPLCLSRRGGSAGREGRPTRGPLWGYLKNQFSRDLVKFWR